MSGGARPHGLPVGAGHDEGPDGRLAGAGQGWLLAVPEGSLPEEVPVALVFDGSTQAVMMATPEDLEDFARGFALSEGIIAGAAEIEALEIHRAPGGIELRHWLAPGPRRALAARRRAQLGPVGCGLCGIDSLAEALRPVPPVVAPLLLPLAEALAAPDLLAALQPLYARTRATHAAGFLRPGAGVVLVREDVGRHNALDKLLGALSRQGIAPASGAVVLTSRVSVELVQKCAQAGCGVLIAVSAPTALAVRLATEAGITLLARVRRGAGTVFSHPARLVPAAAPAAALGPPGGERDRAGAAWPGEGAR